MDWGERRVGLAVSDPRGVIATGLETVEARTTDAAVDRIAAVASAYEVELIVVGLPLLMSGEHGPAAESALRFARSLEAKTGLTVETYDERLTSALSARRLREVGVKTGHARARVDQGAAVALLESYLARHGSRARDSGA